MLKVARLSVRDNYFEGYTVSAAIFRDVVDGEFTRNTSQDNVDSTLFVINSIRTTVSDNTLTNNGTGFRVLFSPQTDITDNWIADSSGMGNHIRSYSDGSRVANNTIINSGSPAFSEAAIALGWVAGAVIEDNELLGGVTSIFMGDLQFLAPTVGTTIRGNRIEDFATGVFMFRFSHT